MPKTDCAFCGKKFESTGIWPYGECCSANCFYREGQLRGPIDADATEFDAWGETWEKDDLPETEVDEEIHEEEDKEEIS